MKNPLLIILLLLAPTVFAQSRYGFETGVDSIALKHHIKRKCIYHVDSDTLEVEVYSYSENGLVLNYEMNKVLPEGNTHGLFVMGPEHVTCEFVYNHSGYLIDEVYNQSGPNSVGYTWRRENEQITSVDTYENGFLRTTVVTSKTSDKNDSSQNRTYTTITYYDEEGRVTQLEGKSWKDVYTYGEDGLLMEMLSTYRGANPYRMLYTYEFYDVNK